MNTKPAFGKRIFAWFMRNGDSINRKLYSRFKHDLFVNLNGSVLDLGAGTGLNLAYAPRTVTNWIAAEPNSAFHGDILKEAANHPFPVEVSSMDAHRLELPDSSVDGVISTLVLCSVDDPEVVLSEIRRVLKPGAPFIFIEHVVSDRKRLKIAQDVFNPLNKVLADGCNCNRDTKSSIETSGLEIVRCESVQVKGITLFHKPHIMGLAVKPNP
jgi:ubiquinone/menaquinone biosynthesis C-methylase UbiE